MKAELKSQEKKNITMQTNELNEFKKYLSNIFSSEKIERILNGIKNPIMIKWIIKELECFHNTLQKKQKVDKYQTILEILEDQIAFCKFAIQDSKCNPTKFIDFANK